MWKKVLIRCKECWESLARWCCDSKDITKEELKWVKAELFVYAILLLFALCSLFFVQVVVAQEAFTLTAEEMVELESLLESLGQENKQLMMQSENLTKLAERLKEALEQRTASLNALQNSYDAYEKEAKRTMMEMSEEIVRQDEKLKMLRKKVFIGLVILLSIILMLAVYAVLKLKRVW